MRAVLRSHFHLAGIDANFRLGDEEETALLRAEVLENLLDDAYQRPENEGFYALLDLLSGARDDGKIAETVLEIYGKLRGIPFYESWIQKTKKSFVISEDAALQETVWGKIALSETERLVEGLIFELRRALFLLSPYEETKKPYEQRFLRRFLCSKTCGRIPRLYGGARSGFDVSFEKLGMLGASGLRGYPKRKKAPGRRQKRFTP